MFSKKDWGYISLLLILTFSAILYFNNFQFFGKTTYDIPMELNVPEKTIEFLPILKESIIDTVINPELEDEQVDDDIQLSQGSYVTILNPYGGQVILARSDIDSNQNYTWILNSVPSTKTSAHTTMLAHFNNDLLLSDGEQPLISSSPVFETAKFDQGLSRKVTYNTTNNLNLSEGTIEFWLTLKKPITDIVFNSTLGDPKFFEHKQTYFNTRYQTTLTSYFRFGINNAQTSISFTVYEGNWADAAQVNTNVRTIDVNKPIHFAITYSKLNNKSNVYMNGFKTSSGRYDFNSPLNETFIIGNNNSIIDEFRVYNKVLSSEEIRFDYTRGIPFSDNDIYFTQEVNQGDILAIQIDQGLISSQKTILQKKIDSPINYIIPYTDNLEFNFTTSSPLICAYGEEPDLFSKLTILDLSPSTTHKIQIPIPDTLNYYPIYIKCGSDDYFIYKRIRVLPEIKNTFPKIANFKWGNNINYSSSEELEYYSRFNLLSISKSNQIQPEALLRIRELNPNIIILSYVTAIGYQNYTEYFSFSGLIERITPDMLMRNAAGQTAPNPNFPNNVVCNLYTGNAFSETLAEHIEEDMIQEGMWNGIWFDVAGSSFWFLKNYITNQYVITPDLDMDGINENLSNSVDLAKATQIWINGMNQLMDLTREKSGNNILLVANDADYNSDNYNGKLWEGKLDSAESGADNGPVETFMRYSDTTYFARSFPYWQGTTKSPHTNWNLFTNTYNPITYPTYHYKRHRFGFAASIISEVYHDVEFSTTENGDKEWYDEYLVDIYTANPTLNTSLGSGYLGEPISETKEFENLVWVKEFQNGIVYLNGRTSSYTFDLNNTYRYINGTQSPTVNKGGLTASSLTIDSKDGIILLRALCSNNPSNDPNCISFCGDSVCSTNETCTSCSSDCGICSTQDPTNIGTTGGGSSGGSSNGGTTTSYCGDSTCNSNEDCNLCPTDCGFCQVTTSDTIYLEKGINTYLQTSGGEYNLIFENKNNSIYLYNISSDSVNFIYNDETSTINVDGYLLFTIDNTLVKIKYLSHLYNQANLMISVEEIQVRGTYNPYEMTYFWIYFLGYILIFLLFMYFKRKN